VYTRAHHSEMEPVHDLTPYVFKMYFIINLFENIRSNILLMKTVAIDALTCCSSRIQATWIYTAGENVCGLKGPKMPGTNTPINYSDMYSLRLLETNIFLRIFFHTFFKVRVHVS
jgi:hypothetical protein